MTMTVLTVETKKLPAAMFDLATAMCDRRESRLPKTCRVELRTGHGMQIESYDTIVGLGAKASYNASYQGSDGESNSCHYVEFGVVSLSGHFARLSGRGFRQSKVITLTFVIAGLTEAAVLNAADAQAAVAVAFDTASERNRIAAHAERIDGRVVFFGNTGTHSLDNDSSAERVLAHWSGFTVRSVPETAPEGGSTFAADDLVVYFDGSTDGTTYGETGRHLTWSPTTEGGVRVGAAETVAANEHMSFLEQLGAL